MTARIVWAFVLAFSALASSPKATAAPIVWNLTGTFDDGGTASGSFTYDVGFNAYSNINIITTSGSAFAGGTYTFINPLTTPTDSGMFLITTPSPSVGMPGLFLGYFALTNAGGTVSSPFISLGEGPIAPVLLGIFSGRSTGNASLVSVPEPSTITLLLCGLTFFTGLRVLRGNWARRASRWHS